jgi:hypothetical protein
VLKEVRRKRNEDLRAILKDVSLVINEIFL